ncbi:hypothetical protein QR680_014108 [Steinernema hermaphroditum]|uniref:Major sperm protein n=1 Tax=Steinernema hermaphroditum TaxID=289476 RepID=A0AA39M2M9_9BILA|nr:hypothetical protein QR680_014108 [Steinernema hermaphroditum]
MADAPADAAAAPAAPPAEAPPADAAPAPPVADATPAAPTPPGAPFSVDPTTATVPAAGGKSSHKLANGGTTRLAFKVRSSNNNEYRLKPVFGFVEAGASSQLEITRLAGAAKQDRMVVVFAEAPAGTTDAASCFKGGPTKGEVTINITAQ